MVEEMHILEKHQAQQEEMNHNASMPTVVGPSAANQTHMEMLAHPTSTQEAQGLQTKRPREELSSQIEANGIELYSSSSTNCCVKLSGVRTDESIGLLSLALDHSQNSGTDL